MVDAVFVALCLHHVMRTHRVGGKKITDTPTCLWHHQPGCCTGHVQLINCGLPIGIESRMKRAALVLGL